MGLANNKIGILSGRFELLHPGHIHTIRRFGRWYRTLYVYIVDNPKLEPLINWNRQIIDYSTMDMESVITKLDPCHFGYATEDDIDRLPRYDDFLSCNKFVTSKLRALGVNVVEFERSAGYSSTEIRKIIKGQP